MGVGEGAWVDSENRENDMNPEVSREVWAWLGPRADVARADPYLGVVFSALEACDERALNAGLAAKHLAKCDRATLGRHCRLVLGQGLARAVMDVWFNEMISSSPYQPLRGVWGVRLFVENRKEVVDGSAQARKDRG
jgi:hypothetical protein